MKYPEINKWAYPTMNLAGKSSTVKSTSALIVGVSCFLLGIKGVTDGVNDLTLSIYDNTEASGDMWDSWIIPAADRFGGGFYPKPMLMNNGIYIFRSGGTGTYTVFYADDPSIDL